MPKDEKLIVGNILITQEENPIIEIVDQFLDQN